MLHFLSFFSHRSIHTCLFLLPDLLKYYSQYCTLVSALKILLVLVLQRLGSLVPQTSDDLVDDGCSECSVLGKVLKFQARKVYSLLKIVILKRYGNHLFLGCNESKLATDFCTVSNDGFPHYRICHDAGR